MPSSVSRRSIRFPKGTPPAGGGGERLWLFIKERFLSHRLWPDYDHIVDAVCQAWQRVVSDTGRIRSLCSLDWARTVRN
jgi:hypothetical protein